MRPPAPPVADQFDRARRRRLHARAAPHFAKADFLWAAMARETRARVELLGLSVNDVLDLGGPAPCWPGAVRLALAPGPGTMVVADEDRLPFADASFDLVLSIGGLASVSDLPGALIQARRVLRPGGHFAAALAGGLTLGELREDLILAETGLLGRAAARVAPMVEAQAAAGLLARAGLVMPVADSERLTVRYPSLGRLIEDLTGMGARSPLAVRTPLRRACLAEAAARFAARAGADGRTAVTVDVLYLAGFAPGAESGLDSPLARRIAASL